MSCTNGSPRSTTSGGDTRVSTSNARGSRVDVSYFGTMMVELGLADGMVSGAGHTTAHTIRPALEVVRTVPTSRWCPRFSSCACATRSWCTASAGQPGPHRAPAAGHRARLRADGGGFRRRTRVAMLSYSTGSSGSGSDVEKVVERRRWCANGRRTSWSRARSSTTPHRPHRGAHEAPRLAVAGHATVFIFPDLNTGNNTYKAVQRSAGALAVGPVLQGLRKPVNDLSRGSTVRDIVNTIAITAIQAQRRS